tara:strand:- start:530 stop:727 length:198 start_codon:yes stop_codon:yes gene_type:complete
MIKNNTKYFWGITSITLIIILLIISQTQLVKIFTEKKETPQLDDLKWLDEMKKKSYEESLLTPKQ